MPDNYYIAKIVVVSTISLADLMRCRVHIYLITNAKNA